MQLALAHTGEVWAWRGREASASQLAELCTHPPALLSLQPAPKPVTVTGKMLGDWLPVTWKMLVTEACSTRHRALPVWSPCISLPRGASRGLRWAGVSPTRGCGSTFGPWQSAGPGVQGARWHLLVLWYVARTQPGRCKPGMGAVMAAPLPGSPARPQLLGEAGADSAGALHGDSRPCCPEQSTSRVGLAPGPHVSHPVPRQARQGPSWAPGPHPARSPAARPPRS